MKPAFFGRPGAFGLMLLCVMLQLPASAQERATSTPVRIRIPTGGAPALQQPASPTATRTPTPSIVMLEAKPQAGPVNVRADADIESDRLGTIQAGELYPVLGRRFRWLQIRFLSAPEGRAWVFEELVTVTGDESSIPNLVPVVANEPDTSLIDATLTQAVFTLTPGAVLTMTASARILPVPGREVSLPDAAAGDDGAGARLPTFTYPPDLTGPTETPGENPGSASEDNQATAPVAPQRIPPALPIALLAAGGLLGLMLFSLRRR